MKFVPLGLVIAFLAAIALVYDEPAIDRLCFSLIVLQLIAAFWSRTSLNGIGLTRTIESDRARVGDMIAERVEFTNHSLIPKLWVECEDRSSLPQHQAGRVVSIRGKGRVGWEVETEAVARGRYQLGPMMMRSADPLGMFPRHQSVPVMADVLVFPARVDVDAIPLPVATLTGGLSRNRSLAMTTPNIAGVREYVPGDPMNHVAWTATARTGRMMVKEFDPDPTADLWILLDLAEDGQFDLRDRRPAEDGGERGPRHLHSTVEYIVSIGASLAEQALDAGRKVGMILNRERPMRIEPDNAERQWFRISEALAVATAQGNRPLRDAITADNRRFTRTSGLVVVSCDPLGDWATSAGALIARQVPVTAVIVDAGGVGDDSVDGLVAGLVAEHVTVHRYATHTARSDQHSLSSAS